MNNEGQNTSTAADSTPYAESQNVKAEGVLGSNLVQWFSPGVGYSYLNGWQSFSPPAYAPLQFWYIWVGMKEGGCNSF